MSEATYDPTTHFLMTQREWDEEARIRDGLGEEVNRLAAEVDRLKTWPGLMETLAELYPPDLFDGSSGDPGPQIIALMREVDRLREDEGILRQQLSEVTGVGLDPRLQELAARNVELSADLAHARQKRDEYRQHILDIDAHATPYGDIPGEPGWVGTYLLTAGALHRALGKIGHSAPKCQAEAELAELGAANASLIRRVADLENQLAEAQRDAEQMRLILAAHGQGIDPDGYYAGTPGWRLRQKRRDDLKATIHPALHELDVRITGLNEGSCHCGLVAEVVIDAILDVDAYDAARKGETDDGPEGENPWATNDVYTVPCPTCGRMASAYCVNAQGREVYPAHAARYKRLTEPMDVPIEADSRAGQAGGED